MKPRILFVDHRKEYLKKYSEVLGLLNINCKTALCSKDPDVTQIKYDLIFVHLSNNDRYRHPIEVIREKQPKAFIVAISADEKGNYSKADLEGSNDFLDKGETSIVRYVRDFIDKRGQQ